MKWTAFAILFPALVMSGASDARKIGAYHENGRDYIKCTCKDSQGGYTTSCYSHSTCDGCCGAHGTGGVSAPFGVAGPFPDRPCPKEATLDMRARERIREAEVSTPAVTTEATVPKALPRKPGAD